MPVASNPTLDRLTVLLRRFDHNEANARSLLHQLAEAAPRECYEAAVELLKRPDEPRTFRYLLELLLDEGMFLKALCDPALNRQQMRAAARVAQEIDPSIDLAVARLADSLTSQGGKTSLETASRLLEALEQITDSRRCLTSLLRLLKHTNPQLRSKAVKLLGRGNRSARWVAGRLAEADPRVRANAIESLDGVDTPEARELLRSCLHDPDNRVVGNGLLALYRLGDTSVLPDFYRIAAHDSPRFRRTAAWAMGQTGDPRFTEALRQLMQDPDSAVRARAFDGLGWIQKMEKKGDKIHAGARQTTKNDRLPHICR
ncbi:MAG TPA: HEAT repeat domain-containing protein [Verrucomicrobiae bacterium]|nr:HEAT repeat domain-containing protein [Verrucomicrobiae bacterium]